MSWKKLGTWTLLACGAVYVVSLIPSTIRPTWSAAPFRKSDPTITVLAETSHGTPPADLKHRIKSACLAAWPFRPLMGSAHKVRVLLDWQGTVVRVLEYDCELYI